jgi:hypothetical protein
MFLVVLIYRIYVLKNWQVWTGVPSVGGWAIAYSLFLVQASAQS